MKTIVNLELLTNYIAEGKSFRETARLLNISLGAVRNQAKKLNLSSSRQRVSNRSWNDEDLKLAVETSTTYAQVIRKLGLSDTAAGNWATIKKYTQILGLDTSHFHGRGWVGNLEYDVPHPAKRALEEILVEDSNYRGSALLKRLVDAKLKTLQCENTECGIENWYGKKLSFELDHKNGNNRDHRIENLRVLCPNCHSQTETWRGRKNKKKI